jgi:hypothetical protein
MSGQLLCHPIIETQYARRRPIVIVVVGNHRRAAIRITDVNKSRGSTQQNRSQSGFLPLYSLSGCRYRGASREVRFGKGVTESDGLREGNLRGWRGGLVVGIQKRG